MTTRKYPGLQDSRSLRGIFARGTARYGPSNSPRPGKLFDVQKAAKKKIKKLQMGNRRFL